jgi:hypothetical protein
MSVARHVPVAGTGLRPSLVISSVKGIPYCALKAHTNFKSFVRVPHFLRITRLSGRARGHPRHRAVLDLSVLKSGWGRAPPQRRARSITIHESPGGVVGEVVEMSMQEVLSRASSTAALGSIRGRARLPIRGGQFNTALKPAAALMGPAPAQPLRNSAPGLDLADRIGILAVAAFALRDFFAVHSDIARRLDTNSNLRSVHRHDGDFDVVADTQRLTGSSCQYQHKFASLL